MLVEGALDDVALYALEGGAVLEQPAPPGDQITTVNLACTWTDVDLRRVRDGHRDRADVPRLEVRCGQDGRRRIFGQRPLAAPPDDTLELPHVARPLDLRRHQQPAQGQAERPLARPVGAPQEALGDGRHVLGVLAQRGHVQRDPSEAVVQVLPEPALGHRLVHVAVGRGDDPDRGVLGLGLVVAQRAVRPELGEVQEQLLGVQRQVQDLVEDQRAAVGELDHADALGHRPGERAALVPEELRGDRVEIVAGPQRRPDHRRASAGPGDRHGEHGLAGAGLALQEDRRVADQAGLHLRPQDRHALGTQDLVEARRRHRTGLLRPGGAQVLLGAVQRLPLLQHHRHQGRRRLEELPVGLTDDLREVSEVEIQHPAVVRPQVVRWRLRLVPGQRVQGRRERRDDPEGGDALRSGELEVRLPEHRLAAGLHQADDRLADLLALER